MWFARVVSVLPVGVKTASACVATAQAQDRSLRCSRMPGYQRWV